MCLIQDPQSRVEIQDLLEHPFWKGKIKPKQETVTLNRSILHDSVNVKNSSVEPTQFQTTLRLDYANLGLRPIWLRLDGNRTKYN